MNYPTQTLIINGVDFSLRANRWQWKLKLVPRTGSNSGQAKSGRTISDLLGYAMRITFSLNTMNEDEAQALLVACHNRYVTATVLDPILKANRTTQFIPTPPELSYCFTRNGVRQYESGAELVLEEVEPYDYTA